MKAASSPASSLSAGRPSLAERVVLGALSAMPVGQLRLETPDGVECVFGQPGPADERLLATGHLARIRVRRAAFFRKCFLRGDIGFAESFIDGDWETPDLTAVIGWFVLNHEHAPTLSGSKASSLALNALRFVDRLGQLLRPNSKSTARRNIADHYDLSNDFFSLWLDDTMMYSAAKWERADATLHEAQDAKNEALCRHLRLRPTDHVLEIGTGWGGWSLHAVRHHGCRVTTVTLSRQQYEFAQRRIAAAGLTDRITVRLQDYREITGRFDKLVSIEMLEAVGHRYLPDFAGACDRLLKPDGLLALQYISVPDHRYAALRSGVDFIQKHIFPGSLLLSVNRVNQVLNEEGRFVLHAFEDFGRDYARTLRLWRASFHEKRAEVRALGFDERFVRKWHYYLCYCEAAFALRHISVVHAVHTRPNNPSF
jgi:cyclopropane-fatty-acyl-phospholipid synthase